MAATVRDPQYVRMESGESFPGSGTADSESICLGDEEFSGMTKGTLILFISM